MFGCGISRVRESDPVALQEVAEFHLEGLHVFRAGPVIRFACIDGQAAKLEKIEMKIAELEATIKMYEVQMNMPQNQTDADAMMELTREYEAAQAQLDEAYEKWEALSES